jgi:hypothetical protein
MLQSGRLLQPHHLTSPFVSIVSSGMLNPGLASSLLKTLLQAAQKDLRGEARDRSTRAGVRCGTSSAAIERNEAYESFSAACQSSFDFEAKTARRALH